ncbi:MAG: hypothetical protein JSS02_17770 [Planctomycetes bacterium]|nr:hypothetical protein [Planctomycetota bacterium]
MIPYQRSSNLAIATLLVALACCTGCSRDSRPAADRFVPEADAARAALDAVLSEWRAGHPAQPIDRKPHSVCVVDKQRKPRQTLEDYEILGETSGEAGRTFVVQVKLQNPAAEEKLRYIVIGINPLWVFRQEDYETLAQWTCGRIAEDPSAENPPNSSTEIRGDSESATSQPDPEPKPEAVDLPSSEQTEDLPQTAGGGHD